MGRVTVAFDSSQAEFKPVGNTGGFKTHTLTVNEIPAHTHTYDKPNTPEQTLFVGVNQDSVNDFTAETATGSTGGGQAHNNLQPYIVVYRFKRTA